MTYDLCTGQGEGPNIQVMQFVHTYTHEETHTDKRTGPIALSGPLTW